MFESPFLDSSKVNLGDQQLILSEKAAAALNGGYLQIVSHDGMYVDKQSLPKLLDGRFSTSQEDGYEEKVGGKSGDRREEETENPSIQRDSDGENKFVFVCLFLLFRNLNLNILGVIIDLQRRVYHTKNAFRGSSQRSVLQRGKLTSAICVSRLLAQLKNSLSTKLCAKPQ